MKNSVHEKSKQSNPINTNKTTRFGKFLTGLFLALVLISPSLESQNVGINATGIAPDNSAMMDVSSTTKGFLLPRMSHSEMNTIATPATGLTVYCTDVPNGFYFFNGMMWVALLTASTNNGGWMLSGNAGTTPGTAAGQNFFGTTDAQDMVLASNGIERLRILQSGAIAFNGATNTGTTPTTTNQQVLMSRGAAAAPSWTTMGGGMLNLFSSALAGYAGNQTVFFNTATVWASGAEAAAYIVMPKCVVTKIRIVPNQNALSSSSTVNLRKNAVTQSSITVPSFSLAVINQAVSISYSDGDYFSLQAVMGGTAVQPWAFAAISLDYYLLP